jgi:hypothetical protein
MIQLLISEEYGYKDWYTELTDQEYQELISRWETIRGLNCLVPVKLIIPQAVELDGERENDPSHTHSCHIHECDDSRLEGSSYKIPEDEYFHMNGKKYNEEEYWRD